MIPFSLWLFRFAALGMLMVSCLLVACETKEKWYNQIVPWIVWLGSFWLVCLSFTVSH